MKRKTLALLLAALMALSLTACGDSSETPAEESTEPVSAENDVVKIDGICVDDSYQDNDGSPLRLVYLFSTVNAGDTNLQLASTSTQMTIGDANTYSAEHIPYAAEFAPNYYYSSYLEDVYVGSTLQVVSTFKVPEGDLTAGKAITLSNSNVPELAELTLSTDDIQHFNNVEELCAAMDPEGYAEELDKRSPADEETTALAKGYLNGYYWSFYVNNTSYEIEFYSGDTFEVRTSLGTSNGGSYTVDKGYITCTYPNVDQPIRIPYTFENNDIDLDTTYAFDVKEH
ncbi:MAG: hypothetical protein IKY34_02645 [Ruminiclostridium sp.]|nr:hypothetical protein [Ruminiclostridium sp.]